MLAVADPGFPRPAAPTAEFGEKLLFSKMSDENYMKMKEIGPVGGGGKGIHVPSAAWICQWYGSIYICI